VPIGAFGGRADVMMTIEGGDPDAAALIGSFDRSELTSTIAHAPRRVAHLGTFNGNPLSMAAGVVTLTQVLTREAYPPLHVLAERLTNGCQAVLDEFGLPGYAINVGPKGCVMFTPDRVTNYRDFIGLDTELWTAFFFYLANRGILLPPGPDDQWTLSVQHTNDEVDRHVSTFRDFARELTS
jgi:glutamate-1-semialdehyde 2,1-aminomutase